jgi:hypothetical protein
MHGTLMLQLPNSSQWICTANEEQGTLVMAAHLAGREIDFELGGGSTHTCAGQRLDLKPAPRLRTHASLVERPSPSRDGDAPFVAARESGAWLATNGDDAAVDPEGCGCIR